MTIDPEHARCLRELDVWEGPITIEPLAGGITNHNYLVRSGAGFYVARLSVARERLGIDRRSERICQREAHALGIAPAIVVHEDGVLVSEYIPGRTLSPAKVREPEFVPRLAAVLRTLHGGWDRLSGEALYFSVFQTIRTYASTAQALGVSLPEDMEALVEDARQLSHGIGPFVPALCHNDLLPANILDSGARIWLVDWEYAGIGHPLFDLAGVSANCGFTDAIDAALLAAYRETSEASREDLRILRVFKAMSLLREALWSAIQTVACEIAFDYAAYAETNFRAYRSARSRIDSS